MTARDAGQPRVTVVESVDPDAAAVVIEGLLDFNRAVIGDPGEEPVQIFLRTDAGEVVGGLLGHIRWRWLYVAKFWIAEVHRGGGHGTALLDAAEAKARAHGCIGAYLDTFEYQARPFYERRGYVHFGTLDGYPPGYAQHYLAKKF